VGSDIRSCTEVRNAVGQWEYVPYSPFSGGRSYAIFGFIGDERNYSHSPVLASYRDVPQDATPETRALFYDEYGPVGYHGINWLSLKEMLDYDYEQVFWDRRVTKQTADNVWDGAALAEEGEGRHVTMREFLGRWYFDVLSVLRRFGYSEDVRIIFGFSS
jgi:hypothetical protein